MAAVFSQAKDNKPGGLNRQAVSGIFEEVGRQAVKHCKQRPNGAAVRPSAAKQAQKP